MENKINIAEILRDMPKGTKLYSPLFGKCELAGVDTLEGDESIRVEPFYGGVSRTFSSKGRYFERYQDAECLLLPSARMRDWNKFFKRGDVLVDEDLKTAVVFDGWTNDDYTEFNTAISHYKIRDAWGKGDICSTLLYTKATDEERAEFKESFKSKCQFEPFQKVLVRCGNGIWGATFFSRCDNKSAWKYVGVDCNCWEQCIPYEGNEHLLGTDKSPE